MYTRTFIFILSTSSCFCYAGYELFQGFHVTDVDDISDTTTERFLDAFLDSESKTSLVPKQNTTKLQDQNTANKTEAGHILTKFNWSLRETSSNIHNDLIETASLVPMKFDCPEEERPSNIGPYEIPTQRDMVLFTRDVLMDMFNSYNKQAFYLLKDIRGATKATSSIENKCEGHKMAYRQCVKNVSRKCQQITKNLVKALEILKQEISNLTEVKICNLSEMKTDPIEILKSLAQEKISVEFALPGFLRLLNECSSHCTLSASVSYYENKPLRHRTDQDLIIKQFLTSKSYLELIMDSRHKTTANSN